MNIHTLFKYSKVFVIILITDALFNRIYCDINNGSQSNDIESKIIGGSPVKVKHFPFAVLFFNFGNVCSGSILNSYSILTAAHCFDDNQDMISMLIEISEYIKDPKGELFEVLSFVIHEDYNAKIPFQADIALIFVKEPIRFRNKRKKAILVNNKRWMKSNTNIVAIGWGSIEYGGPLSMSGLQRTNLRFVTKRKCERLHNVKLADDMFCLYGDGARDTCKGDSGGPVLWNGTVVGIISHGDGCARKDKPSVYISVYYHRKWIKRKVIDFSRNYCKLKEERNSEVRKKL